MDEVPKFLADSQNETTHAIQVYDPLNAAHLLIIPMPLQGLIIYFVVCSPSY